MTAVMLHGGWGHLASNSMALFNIGRGVSDGGVQGGEPAMWVTWWGIFFSSRLAHGVMLL